MSIINMFKKKTTSLSSNSNPSSNRCCEIASPIQFYEDCVSDFHITAQSIGFANKGLIYIPELISVGENTVLSFLQDRFFQMQFGDNPSVYYYAIMSLSIQAGIVFAEKWFSDFAALKSEYVEQIIEEGPANECKAYLMELGLLDKEKENSFYSAIYKRWMEMHQPYWKLNDPREYTFKATVAAYQLGVSMILEKREY